MDGRRAAAEADVHRILNFLLLQIKKHMFFNFVIASSVVNFKIHPLYFSITIVHF